MKAVRVTHSLITDAAIVTDFALARDSAVDDVTACVHSPGLQARTRGAVVGRACRGVTIETIQTELTVVAMGVMLAVDTMTSVQTGVRVVVAFTLNALAQVGVVGDVYSSEAN